MVLWGQSGGNSGHRGSMPRSQSTLSDAPVTSCFGVQNGGKSEPERDRVNAGCAFAFASVPWTIEGELGLPGVAHSKVSSRTPLPRSSSLKYLGQSRAVRGRRLRWKAGDGGRKDQTAGVCRRRFSAGV